MLKDGSRAREFLCCDINREKESDCMCIFRSAIVYTVTNQLKLRLTESKPRTKKKRSSKQLTDEWVCKEVQIDVLRRTGGRYSFLNETLSSFRQKYMLFFASFHQITKNWLNHSNKHIDVQSQWAFFVVLLGLAPFYEEKSENKKKNARCCCCCCCCRCSVFSSFFLWLIYTMIVDV